MRDLLALQPLVPWLLIVLTAAAAIALIREYRVPRVVPRCGGAAVVTLPVG